MPHQYTGTTDVDAPVQVLKNPEGKLRPKCRSVEVLKRREEKLVRLLLLRWSRTLQSLTITHGEQSKDHHHSIKLEDMNISQGSSENVVQFADNTAPSHLSTHSPHHPLFHLPSWRLSLGLLSLRPEHCQAIMYDEVKANAMKAALGSG